MATIAYMPIMSVRYATPLRYPGGKGRLTPYFEKIIEENELGDAIYVEPFAGGAGMAIKLLVDEKVEQIHLNDVDPSIYSFWYSLMKYPDEFIGMVNDAELTCEEWVKQKNKLFDPNASLLEHGFAAFYLNRTNRSGILRAGPIGGIKQEGNYKIDARFNKEELIERLKVIVNHKDAITITSEDASSLLSKLEYPKDRTLIYIDPPYYAKGKSLYLNYYSNEDHVTFSKIVKSLDYKWVLSYDDVPQIRELYQDCNHMDFTLAYSAFKPYVGKEVFFTSPQLKMPELIGSMSH